MLWLSDYLLLFGFMCQVHLKCLLKKERKINKLSLLIFIANVYSVNPHQVREVVEEIMEKLPEEFNMVELIGKAEERTPYQVVALQECERMNFLTREIRRSLQELSMGVKVRRLLNILCIFMSTLFPRSNPLQQYRNISQTGFSIKVSHLFVYDNELVSRFSFWSPFSSLPLLFSFHLSDQDPKRSPFWQNDLTFT